MLGGVTVDACVGGCGGIWFDRGELTFDPPTAVLDRWLGELAAGRTSRVDPAARRRCPRCPESNLMRHFSSATRAVTIDECPTCAGVWLDSGELEQIRSEHVSAEDRRRAVVKAFEERAVDDRMALIGKQLNPVFPFATWRSRVISGAVVALYLGVDLRYSGPADAVRLLWFCLLPVACVWFPDALGDLISGRITKKSPPSFVWFFGWVVLLLPVISVAILLVEGVR